MCGVGRILCVILDAFGNVFFGAILVCMMHILDFVFFAFVLVLIPHIADKNSRMVIPS